MAANNTGQRFESLVQDVLNDVNKQTGALKTGEELKKQLIAAMEATLPTLIEKHVAAAVETAVAKAQEKQALGAGALQLREQILGSYFNIAFNVETVPDGIAAHADLILSLQKGSYVLDSRPTVALAGTSDSCRSAAVVGTIWRMTPRATLVTLIQGPRADTDLLALEALYELSKSMLAKATLRRGTHPYLQATTLEPGQS